MLLATAASKMQSPRCNTLPETRTLQHTATHYKYNKLLAVAAHVHTHREHARGRRLMEIVVLGRSYPALFPHTVPDPL